MASSWRGIVPVRENEDRLPLWQRRTGRWTPTTVAESGSESGAGTTSSVDSRSSSDDDRVDDQLIVPPTSRTIQQLSPIFTNRLGAVRVEDRPRSAAGSRSSSFRENVTSFPTTPAVGGYKRNGSPYHSARYPPVSVRGYSTSDHLTADYVPSWRPDRRFSTPAVPRFRGSVSRSPSPRYVNKKGQQQFEYFRSRAASLPASNGSINAAGAASGALARRRSNCKQNSDNWPQTRSPSRVEERFLKLSESADYDKLRTFVIGTRGELVERGFCYRHRSETASSESAGSTGPTASPNEEARMTIDPMTAATGDPAADPLAARIVPRYRVLVIGAPSVGKSSLLTLLQKSQELRADELTNTYSVYTEPGSATVIPVLICGEEVHLDFYEFSDSEEHLWTPTSWQAAVVVYSISDKRSFSAAADALYQIRAHCRSKGKDPLADGETAGLPIPIVLVANKIDLERQRQVQDQDGMELAKSYECRFVDVSVELTHHVEELLSAVMNEIWRCTVNAYRQSHLHALGGQQLKEAFEEAVAVQEKKPRRFSLRRGSKVPKSPGGQTRSSRAKSLYTLPPGLPAALSQSTSGHQTNHGRSGFFSRLLGRRAVQSCEDLFSRLLRG